MLLKLFKVNVENMIVVLAESQEDAKMLVENHYHCDGIDSSDVLEGAFYSAREIKTSKDVDSFWLDAIPYLSSDNMKNEENDCIADLTCGEIIKRMEAEETENKIRREAEERFDKIQMKLPL